MAVSELNARRHKLGSVPTKLGTHPMLGKVGAVLGTVEARSQNGVAYFAAYRGTVARRGSLFGSNLCRRQIFVDCSDSASVSSSYSDSSSGYGTTSSPPSGSFNS